MTCQTKKYAKYRQDQLKQNMLIDHCLMTVKSFHALDTQLFCLNSFMNYIFS